MATFQRVLPDHAPEEKWSPMRCISGLPITPVNRTHEHCASHPPSAGKLSVPGRLARSAGQSMAR
jgi:hypothetical protein